MSCTVFLVLGPVTSGKTAALVTRCQAVTESDGGAALWIVPSEYACATVRTRLAVSAPAPAVMTFPEFARRVVRTADPAARSVPELHQRLMLEEVLAASARDGAISDFAAVADTRGFADAVFEFVTELKGQGTGAEHFSKYLAAGRGSGISQGRDTASQIATLYERFQKRLSERKLLDRHATYERACQLWSAGRTGPFASVRAVFLDGFTDFTPPQLELLQAVGATVEQVWITVLTDRCNDETRAELFSRPLATLAKLRQLMGKGVEVRTDARSGPLAPRVDGSPERRDRGAPHASRPLAPRVDHIPAGLSHLERSLFRPCEPSSDAAGLRLIEAPGLVGEVRLVARAVKTLLLAGTSAEAIVVTTRDLGPYADLIREVFPDYGLPTAVDGSHPLIRNPAVATLLRAARLAEDDFQFAATTALLRNTYIRPDWPEFAADPDVAGHAEILLRLLGEPRGRDAYLRQARAWANEPQPGLEDERAEESHRRRKHELAGRCLPFLERFFACWEGMPERAGLSDFVDWLREFAKDLGLDTEARRTDEPCWTSFWDELDVWAGQERHIYDEGPTYNRSTFQRLLGTIASGVGLEQPQPAGGVRVLPAEQARHIDCDHLFLLGLGERSFPSLGGTDPLFDDAERQAFRTAGLEVRCAADRLPDEMLLFYQLITRPRRELILSYPAVDAKGQALLPSSFLFAALECFNAGAMPVERRRMLIEGFDRDRPLSPPEYRVRAAAAGASCVCHGHLAGAGSDAGETPVAHGELCEHLRAARRMAQARFDNREFSPYDGMLRSSGVLADLRAEFGPEQVLSPTALEAYVACPFRFYLDRVLKLEPLEEPTEEVEHTRRGAAAHRALSRLHSRRKTAGVDEPTADLVDELATELRKAIDEYAGRVSSPAARQLWKLEGERLIRTARGYGEQWEKFCAGWREHSLDLRPHAFEIDFGLGEGGHGPLVIEVGDVQVRIGGRIDRVDVVELPDGTAGFWVIDYKTGRSAYHTAAGVHGFLKLQLPLYALAVERVVNAGARPLGLAYWMIADGGPKIALPNSRTPTAWLTAAEHWSKFREQLERWVGTLVSSIRRGVFPLKPRDENCTATCSFGEVCRIAQCRSVEKDWSLPLPSEEGSR